MVDADEAPRLDTRILNKIPLLQGRDTAEFRSYSRLRWVCWTPRTRRICHRSKP